MADCAASHVIGRHRRLSLYPDQEKREDLPSRDTAPSDMSPPANGGRSRFRRNARAVPTWLAQRLLQIVGVAHPDQEAISPALNTGCRGVALPDVTDAARLLRMRDGTTRTVAYLIPEDLHTQVGAR